MRANPPAFLAFALLGSLAASAQAPSPLPAPSYRVAQTFHVGGEGAWDYVTVDPEDGLLFVPRATHTLVLDVATGRTIADIPGQKHNHGVAIDRAAGRGFISDGDDASVVIFDLKTYRVLGKVKAQDDADGIIYDPGSDKVFLGCGDGGVVIPISPDVDPVNGSVDPAIDLGGKPEFLTADGAGKLYVNLEDKDLVAVVDTKTMKVIARWPTAPAGSPVGLSMDPVHRRLFIGCRKPQRLVVMGADDGRILASLPIGAGNDATRFDGDIFASCRDGSLAVAREVAPGRFEVVQTVHTALGARTMAVDTRTHALYLPTAEFAPAAGGARPAPKPGTFMIVVVRPGGAK